MKSIWHIASLVFFLLIGPACGVRPVTQADTAAGSDVAVAEPAVTPISPQEAAPTADLSASNSGEDNGVALIWAGQPLGDSPHGDCVSLRIDADSQAFVGPCGEATTPVEFFADQPGGWAEIVARFAPFEQETAAGRIVFRGQGQMSSPAWQRAITTWARFTYAELASGQASASGRTILSWWLGDVAEQPGSCRQLVVLSHSYAYANITPCAGGQVQETVGGWLEIGEWDQFDSWLYDRAPLYQDNNYFSGQNSTEMSQAEAAALADWAGRVYERLAPASASHSQPVGPDSQSGEEKEATAEACPEPGADTKLLKNAAHGYCLLYPSDYLAVQTTDNAVNLVLDTIMNHIDPRVSIEVEEAAGRTAEEFADEVMVDFAPAGWNIERTTVTIGGANGVVLDNMPGADLNRRVIVVHDDLLYHLFFTPTDPAQADVYDRMESFYQTIIDSFTFISVG